MTIYDDQDKEMIENILVDVITSIPSSSGVIELRILDDDSYTPSGNLVFWLREESALDEKWNDVFEKWSASASSEAKKPELKEQVLGSFKAYKFDGQDDVLKLPDHQELNTASKAQHKSFAVVFKSGSDVSKRQVIYEQGGGSRGFNIYLESGKLHASAWNIPKDSGDGAWGPKSINVSISPNTLYHAVLVYDGVEKDLQFFVNGSLQGSVSGLGTLYSHGGDIGIGGMTDGSYFGSPSSGENYHFAELHWRNIVLERIH